MRTGCFYEAITDNINLAGAGPGESDRDQFLQISQNGITGDTSYIHERGNYSLVPITVTVSQDSHTLNQTCS